MRLTQFFLAVLLILVSCKGEAQNDRGKTLEKIKSDQEINNQAEFALDNPLNKNENHYVYNNAELILNQNSNFQEIVFTDKLKNHILKHKLENYFESADINFYLYTSSKNHQEKILLIEGDDYYGGSFGVYYINDDFISKLDYLNYKQNDPENLGHKPIVSKISSDNNKISCKFFVGEKQLYSKEYSLPISQNAIVKNIDENISDTFMYDFNNDKNNNSKINHENFNIVGTWKLKCVDNEHISNLSFYNKREGELEIYNDKKLLAKMMVEISPNIELLKYVGTNIIGEGVDVNNITKLKKGDVLAKVKIIENHGISIEWSGFLQNKLFTQNPFSKENSSVIKKCD